MPALSMGHIALRTTPGWQFFHRYDVTTDEFQVFIRLVDYTGAKWSVNPLSFTKLPASAPLPQALAAPHEDASPDVNGFLQAALDVAWEIGLRPANYAETEGEMKAMRYHLEDMRKLAKVK